MYLKPVFDMGWAPIAALFGTQILIFAAPLTILGEGLVIWRMLPPLPQFSFWRALKASAIMNIVSGILGYLVFFVLGGSGLFAGDDYGATYYESTPQSVFALYLGMMVSFCVVSIVVEGIILGLLESKSAKKTIWVIVLLSNLVSYLGLLVLTFVLFQA